MCRRIKTCYQSVNAPIAPSVVANIKIGKFEVVQLNEFKEIKTNPAVIALDEEREIILSAGDKAHFRMTFQGSRTLDINKILLKLTGQFDDKQVTTAKFKEIKIF